MHSREAANPLSCPPPPGDATAARSAGIRLADLLGRSHWTYRALPFPHIHVRQVFIAAVYEQLVGAFRDALARSARDKAGNPRFVHAGNDFDAYVMPFRPSLAGPLSLFVSKAWVALLAKAISVSVTPDLNGALHYHVRESANGFIHRDFSSCWFIDSPRPDGINITDNSRCGYRTGETFVDGAIAQERVRAVAMLFYLNNAPWSPGDGGETGLYCAGDDPVDRPAAKIPPINNSMVIFECSPYSYHSFIRNRKHPRSSVAIWLHRTKEDAVAKWGAELIVYVKHNRRSS